jgi:hypothetical protein
VCVCVCVCLFDVKLSEDDLKKIETCRSVSELYAKLYFK